MIRMCFLGVAMLFIFAVAAFAQLAAPGSFDLTWRTIDGGGGTSSGGTLTMNATIGQPDAGITMSGGTLTLSGGFWPATLGAPCPADVTGGGSVNIDDLLAVINAWGICPNPCPPQCAADVNGNCLVNIDDLLFVINSWGLCP